MAKKKGIIVKDDKEMISSKVCSKQGICTKLRTLGSAVCLTCGEYIQMIQNDEKLIKLLKLINKDRKRKKS